MARGGVSDKLYLPDGTSCAAGVDVKIRADSSVTEDAWEHARSGIKPQTSYVLLPPCLHIISKYSSINKVIRLELDGGKKHIGIEIDEFAMDALVAKQKKHQQAEEEEEAAAAAAKDKNVDEATMSEQ